MDGKVTSFVVRERAAGPELLLFQHPFAGIQLPAGTIEPGEAPATAAFREATEETGLARFASITALGFRDEALSDRRVIVRPTPVFSRPDAGSFDWIRIRSGIYVRSEREEGPFTQITYEEWDNLEAPSYVSFRISGWAPTANLSASLRRHFFLLTHAEATPERWVVDTDNHAFTLFWAPLRALPAIVPQQAQWLSALPPELGVELATARDGRHQGMS